MAEQAMKNDQGIVGVPTGLTDEKLAKSDLVIIAGRPQWVKLLWQLILHIMQPKIYS